MKFTTAALVLLSLGASSVSAFTISHKQSLLQKTAPTSTSLEATATTKRKCPFAPPSPDTQVSKAATSNDQFFPNRLNLRILQQQYLNDPDPDFEYAAAFASLDLEQVKKDITEVLTTSQDFWPADWGHYGPFMIRQAWHQAGTYRVQDGRGGTNTGNQRFAPLNSWPDNAQLDKARRLLWPVKQKYGRSLSWADLFMLTGNQALDIMGLETYGFGGGRRDIFASEDDVYWGPEPEMLTDERHEGVGEIDDPLGASEMGLIYVNPEGPGGEPDPLAAAKEIRATFANMAMNDEETVALVAGGHTFGKAHGAASTDHLGPEPENAPLEMQGLGYSSSFKSGKGKDTITSGLEGAWTQTPTKWDNTYFDNLYKYDWIKEKGPGGKWQWTPTDNSATIVPDAHEDGKMHKPIMFTTDLALKEDPIYGPISKRFYENPKDFAAAFSRAWYKLTHRDMGPIERMVGADVPKEPLIWQDPIPSVDHALIDESDITYLKNRIMGSKKSFFSSSSPSISQFVKAAWSSASTFRSTDFRGGANGGRIRLEPQVNWEANDPKDLKAVLNHLEKIHSEFNDSQTDSKRVSMADLIVLAGCAAIEEAAERAGISDLQVPFTPGRADATDEQTDVASFAALEPKADGFRNFISDRVSPRISAEELLVDKAHLLSLDAPEMTVLVGGLRVLGATTSSENSDVGVLTDKKESLSNDFFVNLLDMDTSWKPMDNNNLFEGIDAKTGNQKWVCSRVDLLFGSNSELRSIAEYYAAGEDANDIFIKDFVKAWNKVMSLDRYDMQQQK